MQYEGLLPMPLFLEKYKEIESTYPDRIMKLVEDQSNHRQDIEKKVIESNISHEKLGMVFGFILGLVGILMGGFLLYSDKSISGFAVFFTSLGALVGNFIVNKRITERCVNL